MRDLKDYILTTLDEMHSPTSEQVKELRVKHNLTVIEISKLISVSKRMWWRYEDGSAKMNKSLWLMLLMLLNELDSIKLFYLK